MLIFKILLLFSALAGFLAQEDESDEIVEVETETRFLGKNVPNTRAGPIVLPSVGQIWPKPQLEIDYDEYLPISAEAFVFQVTENTCDILDAAIERYRNIILNTKHHTPSRNNAPPGSINSLNAPRFLETVTINLTDPCETLPYLYMDESYTLSVNTPTDPNSAILESGSIWGILRGLETLSQLVIPGENDGDIQIRSALIADYPRFPHRSLLLDSARHFLPLQSIFDNLDLMAMNKLNILHWHLSDNEAFPFKSEAFPNLSARGSFRQGSHEYTKAEVQEVIQYARLRGIRVIPEFDTPGHTDAWFGQPGLLTVCHNNETNEPDGTLGHVDPSNEANYDFFRTFFTEILETFPDKYIHLGGDEVSTDCWDSNPNVRQFMEDNDFGNDYSLLEDYHMSRLVDIIRDISDSTQNTIGWQEVWFNNQAADPDMLVHIWILEELADQLFNVTEAGYKTLLGSCWYLDHLSYGVDWHKYYMCDPHNFNGTDEQKALVLGGGPNMWAEYIDETNLIPLLWPRASVPAERLWSDIEVNDISEAAPRLEEHRCRLLARGYNAQPPNGAGFCY